MLGHDITTALTGLRAEAESRMTDTVAAGVYADGTDRVTGDATRVLVSERYAGKARVRWGSRDVRNTSDTAQTVTVQEPYLSVPFGSPRLLKGDGVVVTDSEDPLMVGVWFTVAGSPAMGEVTAHRYPLKEI